MIPLRIAGCTRVCGKAQGYAGLPVRDIVIDMAIDGGAQPVMAMQTAWEPTPKELEALNAGGSMLVTILGKTPPPISISVEPRAAGLASKGGGDGR